ncbi:MAG: BTAD domain-containing putative transcriptional regulator [Ilumatobacteraceae bacterium]|nr:BTAD domain-containing putative transcriptional regulator [Ilumatobacteraceae bacterium]
MKDSNGVVEQTRSAWYRIRVLGPVVVERDGEPVDIGGPKPTLLLALLTAVSHQVVSVDTLIDGLWGDDPPATARKALQVHVSNVRRALGAEFPLRTAGGGYVVDRDRLDVDAIRFESELAAAVAALPSDPRSARDQAVAALARWRGAAYAGLDAPEALRGEVARLTELRHQANTVRLESRLLLGQHTDVVAELDALTTEHPYREDLRRLHMIALYRSGRQTDALRSYDRTRDRLRDDLGLDPSAELRALQRQVLDQAPELDLAPSGPATSGRAPTAAGRLEIDEPEARDISGHAVRGYELRDPLGEAAHAVVYRAYQASVGREVAIKVIRPEYANQPGFVKRFEAEAQYVARLEHPHIVPLYDYWRDPDGAYLVMQWLRAGSLASALEESPWDPPAALRLLDQVGSALSYAHRHGVLHRDVKPANVLLDGEGNAYLGDFGIAAGRENVRADCDDSSRTYVAPEELAGVSVGAPADLYAFALLANELLTGTRPTWGSPPVSVTVTRPDLPVAIDAILAKATDADPQRRYQRVEDLLRALRQAFGSDVVTREVVPDAEVRNPYKGLRAFTETDASDYFGRTELVERVVDQISRSGLTVVVGPSGSGKSSLVKAGVLPVVRRDGLRGRNLDHGDVFVAEMFPGTYPFEELESALLRVAVDRPASLIDDLTADDRGLLRVSKQILPDDTTTLLLVIDQFEELFSMTPTEEVRRRFLDNLVTVAGDERSRVRIVATIRADFFDRPLAYPAFGALMSAALVPVPTPTDRELAATIAGPARNAGLDVETGLIPLITRDVADEPGALPLMQHALSELVGEREGRTLTIEAYERTGGVIGSLARRAEDIFVGLPAGARSVAEELFVHLVVVDEESDDTRRRVRRTELDSIGLNPTALDTVLGDFGSFRLLTFDHDPVTRGQTVEVAHEALIREWPRLRGWIDARREGLILQRRLQTATNDWLASRREPSFLFAGGRLDQYELWAGATNVRLTADESAFLDEGRRVSDDRDRRAARRRRSVLAGVAGLAVVALVVAAVALVQRRRADQSAAAAAASAIEAEGAAREADALRVVADEVAAEAEAERERAEQLRSEAERRAMIEAARAVGFEASRLSATDPDGALEAAIESADRSAAIGVTLPETMSGLWDATQSYRRLGEFQGNGFFTITGQVAGVSPDGRRAVVTVPLTRSEDSESVTRIHDVSDGQVVREFGPPDGIQSTWDQRDDEIIIATAGGELQWWDPTGRRLLRSEQPERGSIWYVEATDDHLTYSRVRNRSNGVSTVVIRNRATGDDVVRIDDAYWARLSPGGRLAVIFLIGRQVAVVDLEDGSELMRIDHGLDPYMAGSSVEWIGDDDRLLLPRPDGTIAHVDVREGSIVDPYPNTLVGLVPVGIRSSPDGRLFAEADSDTSVRVYETDSHREVLRLDGHDAPVGAVQWVGADRLISKDDSGRAIVWDLAPPSASTTPFVSAGEFPVHHDTFEDRYVMVSSRRARGQVWDTLTGELVVEFEIGDDLQDLNTVTHTELGLIAAPAASGIRVFDVGRREWVLDLRSEALDHPLAFSPDGRLLLAGSAYSALNAGATQRSVTAMIDVATGEELWRFDDALTVAGEFLPDGGTVVLSGPRDVNIIDFATRFVDVDTGVVVGDQRLFWWINDIAVAPDGTSVAVAQSGDDGEIVVYDVARAVVAPLADAVENETVVSTRGSIKTLEYSPDGSILFVGSNDGVLRALDASNLEPVWSIDNGFVFTELRFVDGLMRFAVPAGLPVGIGHGPYGIIGVPYDQAEFADWARSLIP